eukprot:scaffold35411_cov56-Attheya_sp.AAC.3
MSSKTKLLQLPEITRRSLQSLAGLQLEPDSARAILQDVAARLAGQQLRLETLGEENKNVRHLHYLHKDTARLCLELCKGPVLLDRWSAADQRVVSTTLEQVRDRHATSLERLVDLIDSDAASEQTVQSITQARWGIQLLCDHYVKGYKQQRPHGAVSLECALEDVVRCARSRHGSDARVRSALDDESRNYPA